jgi:hypothetical protein
MVSASLLEIYLRDLEFDRARFFVLRDEPLEILRLMASEGKENVPASDGSLADGLHLQGYPPIMSAPLNSIMRLRFVSGLTSDHKTYRRASEK